MPEVKRVSRSSSLERRRLADLDCAWPSVKLCEVGIMCSLARPGQARPVDQQSFQAMDLNQVSPRSFNCSHIQTQMVDNGSQVFASYFHKYLVLVEHSSNMIVYLVLNFIIFFRSINHNNRIKASSCLHHISLAIFATALIELCFKA